MRRKRAGLLDLNVIANAAGTSAKRGRERGKSVYMQLRSQKSYKVK